MSKKYFIDMGSCHTKVYTNTLLLKQPSCVVIKKGFKKALAVGEKAFQMKEGLDFAKRFIAPISNGAVTHFNAAILMIKEFLGGLKIPKSSQINAFFSCGLNADKRKDLERVFWEAGYKNVMLFESLQSLKPYVAAYGNMVVADIGHSKTDVGIINEEGIVMAYNLNIGANSLNERIINRVESLFKVKINDFTAEKIKLNIASLYEKDNTTISFSGLDIITSQPKTAKISARDIYEDVLHCYLRIVKVIEGSLVVAPIECIEGIAQRGLFLTGGGSKIIGLDDFIYDKLRIHTTGLNPFIYG